MGWVHDDDDDDDDDATVESDDRYFLMVSYPSGRGGFVVGRVWKYDDLRARAGARVQMDSTREMLLYVLFLCVAASFASDQRTLRFSMNVSRAETCRASQVLDSSIVSISFNANATDIAGLLREYRLRLYPSLAPDHVEPISSIGFENVEDVEEEVTMDDWTVRSVARWKLRIDRVDTYQVRLCAGATCVASPRAELAIVDCASRVDDDATFVPSSALSLSSSPLEDEIEEDVVFRIPETVAFDGARGLSVPHDVLAKLSSSWSFRAWIFISEPSSSSSFRGILYKGPNEVQRTPSVWLVPNSTRLTVKVSTAREPDVGGETRRSLPIAEWVHVAFLFRNFTDCTGNRDACFEMSTVIDGVPDATYSVVEPVLGNDGPLYVGKDPWLPGFRGLMSGIEIVSSSTTETMPSLATLRDQREQLASSDLLTPGAVAAAILSRVLVDGGVVNEVGDDEDVEARACFHENGTVNASYVSILEQVPTASSLEMLGALASSGLFRSGLRRHPFDLLSTASPDHVADGLLLAAAVFGSTASQLAIGRRRRASEFSCESRLASYRIAVDEASSHFHTPGREPIAERERLTMYGKANEGEGQRGLNDEEIQWQIMQAEKGDPVAMVASASLFYYGARGVPRDQARAFRLFQRASAMGNTEAETAMGNLLMKGEGCERNASAAVAYYERAAKKDDAEALNGLGYAYAHGHGVERINLTTSLRYFERATETGRGSADSWFNAGYMHHEGMGTTPSHDVAHAYWYEAAARFGHFDAIVSLGRAHANGDGSLVRSCENAMTYMRAAVRFGPWGGHLRSGYDRFLSGDTKEALASYVRASLTDDVGAHNAAFVLDRTYGQENEAARLYRSTMMSEGEEKDDGTVDATLRLAEFAEQGRETDGRRRYDEAAALYTTATDRGSAHASYRLAALYEQGHGVPKSNEEAERYYRRTLELLDRDGRMTVSGQIGTRWATWLSLLRLKVVSWFYLWLG